ncbi:hypothetical protein LAZ67_19001552, partial [Cordylochernes scorpioides]
MSRMATSLVRAESPSKAAQEPVRRSTQALTCAELSAKDLQKKISNNQSASQNYANPPTGVKDANLAAARGDVTTGSAAATSSNGAARVLGNWADCTEDQGPGEDDDFTVIKNKKRRRDSPGSPAAAAPSSGTRGAGTTRRPRSSTGWAPRAEEVRTTRAHIAEARARQASSTEDHCVFVERSPELEPYHYMRAIDRMFGSTRDVFQVTKMNGHFLVGMASRGMAERLVNEGLEVEGTLHRAFPFRKRAERITVGNLPFFVGDAAVISALSPFGRVTSIAPKLMKAGPYVYNDGRREAFIILREGMTIERLPTRLDIPIKGEAWPAYLSSGIRCSRCRGQGHRRANCPLLAGRTTEPGPATPTSPTSVPPATAPKLPQQPSAKPPPPSSPSPAMEVSDVPPASRAALLPPAALRSSPPAPLASPAEETPPPPPPVTPASPLRAPGGSVSPQSAKSQPSAQDIEMTTIEESSASSTASSRKSTREDLVTLIRKSPAVSFAETDALGLGREEILDLLSSKTRAQRQGPLLTPPQNEALAGMIKRLLGLKPGSNTSVYKVLRQVKSVLRTGPAAVPPTPTLTASRPAKPTPPVPQRKESAPTRAASLLAMPIKTDEDRKRWLRDTFKELDHRNILRPILEWIDEDPIINSGREPILQPLPQRIEMEDDHRPTVSGSYLPCQRQRDPSTFSGDGNINPGQWLKEYERVSKYNRWDETMKLANVVFYLNGTAGRWFDNNEESLNSWRSFEDAFRGVFGLQEDSARRAEEVLKSRAQKAEESSESYIQEILSLCHQVNPRMEEVLTTVKQRRIGRTKFARLSNVMPISCVDDSDDLAGLIRRIVREEIQKVFSAPEVINPLREVNALEQTVREEVSRALQPTRPQVNVVQQQPRTPFYNIDRPTQPRKTEHWRTYDDKPICFHCGRPGHVVRYCRERRQVFAEARSRNGGEGRNVGFSSRPPRYDADDDYVTPQTSTYFYRSSSPHPNRARSPARRQSQSPARRFSRSPMPQNKINLTLDPGLSEIQRLQLVSCLDEFIGIFDFGSTPIKPTSTVKHKINTGDQSPIKQRPYRVAPSERRLIQDEVNKMIENHIVKPSESPWSSPVILVRKKDGTWRFCVDYRRLNKITKKDVYPLPRIDDALDSLAGSSYFSTMDLRSGYWQIEVDEKDREKTAFITPDGLYEFQVMPFGRCNAPATFERMIDSVLGSLKWNMCLCYLDDIVVYAPTFEEHLRRLQLVLSCIQKAGLSLNHKKCLFGSRRIKILGHLVDANGIHPDPDKVEAVSKFPRPRNISELKSFLGLCSYYRRFIENFADKARSLHDLLKTEKHFYWDAAQEKAFEVLKTALISEPVLGHFDESADTHLHTDASGHGIGAVLLQIQGGKERPIAYASRSLTKAENNYSTTEKECLDVVWSISEFRPYLFGRPFTVVTDHHSLCWLVGQKDPSGRLARWALKLQEFDVTVIYKSGRKHKDADCLSRSPLENDPPSAVMSLTNVDIEQTKDPDLAKTIDNLNSGYTRKEFSIIDGILYKKNYSTTGRPWLMMIPKHLRSEVMADLHDAPTAGHLGFARTYDKVKKRFYWPGLYRTVRQYVSHCRECQRRKKLPRRPAGQLVSMPPLEKPFYKVGVDLLGRFPVSKDGNRWIIVCTDYMTRYAITKAIPDGGAIETAKFLVEDVILKHGAPREMITDRGRNFISQVIKEINALCGIVHRFTTAYHPQTNGLTERFNKTLRDMLSMYTGVDQKDWDQVLPYVTFAYNTAKQEATGYTPFFLVHAREAETYIDAVLPYLPDEISNDYVGELVTRAEEARQLSRSRLLQSQAKDRRLYDQKHTPVYYQKNDLVWVFTPIRKVGLSEKLLKRYFGPYKVTKKLSEVTESKHHLSTEHSTASFHQYQFAGKPMQRILDASQNRQLSAREIFEFCMAKEEESRTEVTAGSKEDPPRVTPTEEVREPPTPKKIRAEEVKDPPKAAKTTKPEPPKVKGPPRWKEDLTLVVEWSEDAGSGLMLAVLKNIAGSIPGHRYDLKMIRGGSAVALILKNPEDKKLAVEAIQREPALRLGGLRRARRELILLGVNSDIKEKTLREMVVFQNSGCGDFLEGYMRLYPKSTRRPYATNWVISGLKEATMKSLLGKKRLKIGARMVPIRRVQQGRLTGLGRSSLFGLLVLGGGGGCTDRGGGSKTGLPLYVHTTSGQRP